jgi:hypothetical protein
MKSLNQWFSLGHFAAKKTLKKGTEYALQATGQITAMTGLKQQIPN